MAASELTSAEFETRLQPIVDLLIEPASGAFKHNADVIGATMGMLALLDSIESHEGRVAMLSRLAKKIGDDMFPAFIKLLMTVGESEDTAAQVLLAETFAHALSRGDVPSGTLSSWGIPAAWSMHTGIATQSFFRSAARRNLDPIEFVAAWHGQETNRPVLRDQIFARTLGALLRLFSANRDAAALYQAKLRSDTVNQPVGTFTESTRLHLVAIADAWQSNESPEAIVQRVLGSTPQTTGTGMRVPVIISSR